MNLDLTELRKRLQEMNLTLKGMEKRKRTSAGTLAVDAATDADLIEFCAHLTDLAQDVGLTVVDEEAGTGADLGQMEVAAIGKVGPDELEGILLCAPDGDPFFMPLDDKGTVRRLCKQGWLGAYVQLTAAKLPGEGEE